jgi:hypothetical protein
MRKPPMASAVLASTVFLAGCNPNEVLSIQAPNVKGGVVYDGTKKAEPGCYDDGVTWSKKGSNVMVTADARNSSCCPSNSDMTLINIDHATRKATIKESGRQITVPERFFTGHNGGSPVIPAGTKTLRINFEQSSGCESKSGGGASPSPTPGNGGTPAQGGCACTDGSGNQGRDNENGVNSGVGDGQGRGGGDGNSSDRNGGGAGADAGNNSNNGAGAGAGAGAGGGNSSGRGDGPQASATFSPVWTAKVPSLTV